jgi:tRNA(Ile)-lysidine synthase
MTLPERVLRTVRKHGLLRDGDRVVVALSGGPDSVALVHLLRELEPTGLLTLAGVAHFNHRLRGADADADQAFCVSMARDLGLPIEVGSGDVRTLAREQRRSIEDAARQARYAFLHAAAARLHASAVAVGHSLDDQAETFLLRLMRGAGARGLAGIYPRAGTVVRPLIEIRREELRAYLTARGLPFCQDATNSDLGIARNRVRHELIPYLATTFSPGVVEVLAREAVLARQDEEFLEAKAIELARSIVLAGSLPFVPGTAGSAAELRIDRTGLLSLAPALASRVVRLALGAVAPGKFIGFDQVERFLEFARDARPGAALSLPGQQARRDPAGIVLAAASGRPEAERSSNSFRVPLSIPGEVTLPGPGWIISAAEPGPGASPPRQASKLDVSVQAAQVRMPLAVRSRQPGDRFRPAGLGGRGKKVQDLFVDRKVPRDQRDSVPIVVDGNDRIVWIVGEPVAEDFRVTEPSRGVIFLKARRLGGLG